MKQRIYLYSVILMLFSACNEGIPFSELDFENIELNYEIAVDGFISTEKEPCRIKLTKPFSISEASEPVSINDATIVLKHNSYTYDFRLYSDGVYFSVDSIVGLAGETYILEIRYKGKTYTAEEIMPDPPNDDFFLPFTYDPYYPEYFSHRSGSKYISYNIPTHNFGYDITNIWKWNLGQSLSFNRVFTHKGSIPQGILSLNSAVTVLQGASTDSLILIKSAISESYNQYLLDKFNETVWQGRMFSTIPGNVSTNLSEGAVGYFYALNVKRKGFIFEDFVDLVTK